MEALTAATVGALVEVLLIIATHGRCDTRDVIPPTGKNVAHYRVDTAILACVG
jgi:hypothetical protein